MVVETKARFPEYRIFAQWRLIAAMLVMMYHYVHAAPHADVLVDWFENMNPLLDMFFVLSGFLIYERYRNRVLTRGDYAFFVLRRFSRLYPLHLVTLGFFVAVAVAAQAGLIHANGLGTRYDFGQLVPNLLLIQAWGFHDTLTFNFVSWSLSGEWFAYLLLPILAFMGLRFGPLGLLAVLAVTLSGLEWASRDAADFTQTWYDAKTWGAYRIFADFTFGAILFCIAERMPARFGSRPLAWLLLGLAVAGMHAGQGTYGSLAIIGIAIVFGAVAERDDPDESALTALIAPVTMLSYGIYMWHPVLETVFFSGVWKLFLGEPATAWFYAFMVLPMLATIIVAAASLRWFETPASRMIMTTGQRLGRRPSIA
ncbi:MULTISPECIES: acyltransferase [unclassified Roseitalea]|uniref:acyltransferase family protein n=1 Tax=unclassified Roseitalea TaxID=2639107 RepID=UPI00273DB3E4|nr:MULTISPECIES: acyltransferase [unclassified Roseitalea]